MDTIFVYDGLVTHFGDVEYTTHSNWYLATDPITTGVVGVIVQLFYAWRIYVLIQSWILVLVVVSVSLVGGAGSIVITYKVSKVPDYINWDSFNAIGSVWLGCACAADILITISLVWYLQKTGFKSSNMLIDRIIRITMQTGLLTSIIAISNIIIFIYDRTGTHLIVNTPLCKIYSNSLLSSLNARGGWKFKESSDSSQTEVATFHANTTSGSRSLRESATSFISRMVPLKSSRASGIRLNRRSVILMLIVQANTGVIVHVESHEMEDEIIRIPAKRTSTTQNEHDGDGSSAEYDSQVGRTRKIQEV
ncbi:hypothetical protein NP233_g2742 [Leucocoprinus birnbaumii]|uniref:DUF6534 domain-containing protein n=1 Tax=Leucocoprinus birnbaumii TaxID=56174 RepID=A0AAD5W046_9AGAR|nr:hypothetical protein NP233_g2742 [Leucocoprinus birnbaumii]